MFHSFFLFANFETAVSSGDSVGFPGISWNGNNTFHFRVQNNKKSFQKNQLLICLLVYHWILPGKTSSLLWRMWEPPCVSAPNLGPLLPRINMASFFGSRKVLFLIATKKFERIFRWLLTFLINNWFESATILYPSSPYIQLIVTRINE